MQAQVLDSMELERERGITIKAQSVTLYYKARDGERYQLNLIDTPGPRRLLLRGVALAGRLRGALLVVDASQGVEAQSVANCYTAIEQGLEVVPVINKIDLPSADPERVMQRDRGDHRHRRRPMPCGSAPRPARASPSCSRRSSSASRRRKGDPEAPLQALIIDSWFDNYVGVVSLVRVDERRAARPATRSA